MKRKLEKPRTDKELKEAYEKTFNYDPTDEEVDAKYDEDFEDELIEEILNEI